MKISSQRLKMKFALLFTYEFHCFPKHNTIKWVSKPQSFLDILITKPSLVICFKLWFIARVVHNQDCLFQFSIPLSSSGVCCLKVPPSLPWKAKMLSDLDQHVGSSISVWRLPKLFSQVAHPPNLGKPKENKLGFSWNRTIHLSFIIWVEILSPDKPKLSKQGQRHKWIAMLTFL